MKHALAFLVVLAAFGAQATSRGVLVVVPPPTWPVQIGVQGDGYPGSNVYCTAVLPAPYESVKTFGNGSGQCQYSPMIGGTYNVTVELTTTVGGTHSNGPVWTGQCALQTGANLGYAPQYCYAH